MNARGQVLASAGVDMNELKTFFRAHKNKRRSSAVGVGVLRGAPLLSPEPVAEEAGAPALVSAFGAMARAEPSALAGFSGFPAALTPVAAPRPVLALEGDVSPAPAFSLPESISLEEPACAHIDPPQSAAERLGAGKGGENESPNVIGSVHARDASDECLLTGSSHKKSRRKRRQSFSLAEISQRIKEIAESGASPMEKAERIKHGLPSPMPMESMTLRGTPTLGALPSLSAELRAAATDKMDVDGDDGSAAKAAAAAMGVATPTAALRPPAPSPVPSVAAAAAAATAFGTPVPECTPTVDLAHARQHAPLTTCDAVIGHLQAAARHARLGNARALQCAQAAVREVATFAELWHWEEESRLAVSTADASATSPARAPRVRFCALEAASLEPPAWSDDSCAQQQAALEAILPALRSSAELHAALADVPAAKLKRFLLGAAALVAADGRLGPSGAAAFWRAELLALSNGERLYANRGGALVLSLVRHELRALALRNELGEEAALRTLPSPRGGPVLRPNSDSVARLISNALRVWEGSRATLDEPRVLAALGSAAGAAAADGEEEALTAELLADALAAADAHAALSHLVRGCAFLRAAASDEHGSLRRLLALGELVPGWVDEFAPLAQLADLDAELERVRGACSAARARFPAGAEGVLAAEADTILLAAGAAAAAEQLPLSG
ncbi:hypothetical protein T492DRAFT_969198 [Pavlovales sp. CCMP2436]|nr:hypothetical protein T492DRAFT_969198 [Pavlovales sp. CCMP2436]